jgi:hypothetical protein
MPIELVICLVVSALGPAVVGGSFALPPASLGSAAVATAQLPSAIKAAKATVDIRRTMNQTSFKSQLRWIAAHDAKAETIPPTSISLQPALGGRQSGRKNGKSGERRLKAGL